MVDVESGMTVPVVSVIIACYNVTKTLPLQLEALSRQEDAPSFEVILSDNGSDDDLMALADDWADRLDLHYVWSGQIRGAAYARNVGMSIAKADKWLFCDADDVVAPDWVGCGATMLDSVPVFSGGAAHVDDSDLDASLDKIWTRFGPSRRYQPIVAATEPSEWPIIMGGNFGIRRVVALAVGGFDAAMERGVEDNDLAIRLEKVGTFVTGGSTTILYRKRKDHADILERSFIAGRWHMALVERHGLASRSPQLRGRRWMGDTVRVAGAALKNALKLRDGDWSGVLSRAGLTAGLWSGWTRYRVRKELPAPMVGAGLGCREPDLKPGTAVLVLSPHLDDALFSCAELIRRTRPEVWTVFAGDPEPAVTTTWDRSCGYPDSHALVTQRRREDHEAFDGTGVTVRHLDMLDGAYTSPSRRAADLASLRGEIRAWLDRHADQHPVVVVPACAGAVVAPGVLDRAAVAAGILLRRVRGTRVAADVDSSQAVPSPDETRSDDPSGRRSTTTSLTIGALSYLKSVKHRIYVRRRARAMRSGFAVNTDHVAVRETALNVIDALSGDETRPEVRALLVEDLPYLWSNNGDGEIRRISKRVDAVANPLEFHVDRSWKHSVISHYSSQLDVMDPVHHRLNSPVTIPPVERCWELVRHR